MEREEVLAPGVPRSLWGKGRGESFHPLLLHMLDVGFVARSMLVRLLSVRLARQILGGIGPEQLGVLVALHDLGKASPAFQLKREDLLGDWRAGYTWPEATRSAASSTEAAHGLVGAAALRSLFAERYGLSVSEVSLLADSLAGHHGRFAEFDALESLQRGRLGRWSGLGPRQQRWVKLRADLAAAIESAFDPPTSVPPRLSPVGAMVLAGLTSVADWIGSNEEWFPYRPDDDLQTYVADVAERADAALTSLGFVRWVPRSARFADRFGFSPHPLQARVAELGRGLAEAAEPAIVVIEAEMGSGKTEAAFDLAAELVGAGLASGAYVALPTRATANQMFHRVVKFLRACSESPEAVVQLAHGLARLDADFDELLGIPPAPAVAPTEVYDDSEAQVRAAEWFTASKRSLLSPWGVGTVDAALMAALRVKHGPVRLFGLADKVVVIDEVHAYDLYMSTLLDRLLGWLGRLGVSVVLLSATLPTTRRRELLAAWSGRTVEVSDGYPLVSWATCESSGSHVTEPARPTEIRLDCRLGASDPATVAKLLMDAVEDGGCAAMVCNTVGRAQEVFVAVWEQAHDIDVHLLHSRIPFDDRLEREKLLTAQFGREGNRPQRAIVVATQVIEQSLDVDFDLLVTDLAPIDLVLQRMGRLHRHDRRRPAMLSEPTLVIVGWGQTDEGRLAFPKGSVSVYGEYVLVRSADVLLGRERISVPSDLPLLVDAVYSDSPVSEPLVAQADAARESYEKELERERYEAKRRYIPAPEETASLAGVYRHSGAEEQPELPPRLQALTRLGANGVDVVLLAKREGRLRLGPEGSSIDLTKPPDRDLTRALLGRSVNLTHRGVANALLAEEKPASWAHSPWLRHHRLIVTELDSDGDLSLVGKWTVKVDPLLGVVIGEAEGEEV